MSEELKRVEAVLDEKVRPSLRSHGGAIEVDRLENRVLYVKLLGQCAGCPSADLTTETLVEAELVKALVDYLLERKDGSAASRKKKAAVEAMKRLAIDAAMICPPPKQSEQ